eukprot:2058279-Pleurochrysis_carterae.AAC.1
MHRRRWHSCIAVSSSRPRCATSFFASSCSPRSRWRTRSRATTAAQCAAPFAHKASPSPPSLPTSGRVEPPFSCCAASRVQRTENGSVPFGFRVRAQESVCRETASLAERLGDQHAEAIALINLGRALGAQWRTKVANTHAPEHAHARAHAHAHAHSRAHRRVPP